MAKETLKNQQGDVLVLAIDGLPTGLKRVEAKGGRLILAEGEATGHAHAISEVEGAELFVDDKGEMYLVAKKDVVLAHEEHKAQTIQKGTYKVRQVVEVDPFTEAVRRVAD